ncbi:acyl carrier protein [Streptomyces palmae]|uniref:Acyl carrier protein n=1 Tax=Streptomyces palmae TaxID=1701085 RepID=A0A4Z0H9N8_9ACTN|nr:acyl carrier protein [Streptomyces palmae]TGB07006.1 acyl carrier protein [Streptomyces palmae]
MSPSPVVRTDAAGIADWLHGRIAAFADLAPDSFTDEARFTDLGFTSVYALVLCGEIEDTFGIEVEPNMIWDYPTVRELAAALAELP